MMTLLMAMAAMEASKAADMANVDPFVGGFTPAETKSLSSRPPSAMDIVCPTCGEALILICSPSLLVRLQGEKITALQLENERLREANERVKAVLARWEAFLTQKEIAELSMAEREREAKEREAKESEAAALKRQSVASEAK